MSEDLLSNHVGASYGTDSGHMNFDEMCVEISKGIYLNINGVDKLEKCTQMIGTDTNSLCLRDRMLEASESTGQIVKKTMASIKMVAAPNLAEWMKQVQLYQLMTQFRDFVQRFTKLQNIGLEKMRVTDEVREKNTDLPDDDNYSDRAGLVEEQERRLQIQDENIDNESELVREREYRIRQLKADIIDVNEIYHDLTTMTQEHGATIDSTEANVETNGSVEAGTAELTDAQIKKKRRAGRVKRLLKIIGMIKAILAMIGFIYLWIDYA